MPVHWNVVSGEMAEVNGKYERERCCFGLFGMGKILGYIAACEEQRHGPRHGPCGLISLFLFLPPFFFFNHSQFEISFFKKRIGNKS